MNSFRYLCASAALIVMLLSGCSAPHGQPPNPDFDHAKYDAIGESDRMTLRFRKPE